MTDHTEQNTLRWALRITESMSFSNILKQATLLNFLLQEKKVTLAGINKNYEKIVTYLTLTLVLITCIPYNIIKQFEKHI